MRQDEFAHARAVTPPRPDEVPAAVKLHDA